MNHCFNNSECQTDLDRNQVCIKNMCVCQPNYKWNKTNTVCTHFNCSLDEECFYASTLDHNRICSNNKCICDKPYYEDSVTKQCISEFRNTSTKSPIEIYCNDINNCGLNQFCVDNRCECLPNYEYSYVYNGCVFKPCFYSNDCTRFDANRICSNNGYCNCRSGYTVNPKKICNRTVESYCNSFNDCGSNQFCVNHLCECQPNYVYNSFDNSCHLKYCSYDSDCNTFDKNSVCLEGYCKCRSGYKTDPKTKFCIITVEKSCNTINDCGINQFCVNNLCECQPNYVFNQVSNSCLFNYCNYDTDCNQFDSKRVCLNRMCDSCKTYYAVDPITKFCNTTTGLYCSSNYDCTKYGDFNQVCVDNSCQCGPNYQIDNKWGDCSYHSCYFDSECQTYDKNRVCRYGLCQCDTNYRTDSNSQKCIYYSANLWWIWLFLWIPAVFIVITVVRIYKQRKIERQIQQSNQSINSCSPILQSNQYLTNSSQHVTINDPPPPYST